LTIVPTIIANPLRNQPVFPGGTATFNPEVEALIPVTYQWQFNGTNIIGATNGSLVLTNVQFQQGGTYSLIYNDAYETVTNSAQLYLTRIAAWGFENVTPPVGSTNLIAVGAGSFGIFALNSDHTVITVPANPTNGQVPTTGSTNVIAISVGDETGLVLKAEGTVVAWGNDQNGETNVPAGLSNVVAIAAGGEHELVLRSDGTVVAWGNNDYGQTDVPPGLGNVVAIAAGEWNSLALKSDGTVVAWGDDQYGETNVPAGLSNVVRIATGEDVCGLALSANGIITGWGDNTYGELTLPSGLTNVIAIAASGVHSLALRANGTVAAWGDNEFGETNIPPGLTNVVQVSAYNFQSLALVGDAPPTLQVAVSNFCFTAGGFNLSVTSMSGRVYALEYSPLLPGSNWTALPLVAGTGATLTLTDPATNSPQRFYRVLQW
jgi:hypothetical protein